jgi:ABC-2 type transport system permease protein
MVTWLYGFFVLLMILIPVFLAVGLRRAAAAPWLLFAAGCLTFAASQAVHLPLNQWLADIGLLPGGAGSAPPLAQTALIAGLTAGLCEELARAAGFALIRKFRPAWTDLPGAVMLGLGHGGFESMVFGGVLTAATVGSLLPLIGADLTKLGLTADQLDLLRAQIESLTAHPWNGAYAVLERIIALSAHVTFSLMVAKAFSGNRFSRAWFYIPLAVLYHAAVDFAAVYGANYLKDQAWLAELAFAGMLIPGYVWVTGQFLRWRNREAGASAASAGLPRSSIRSELAILWAAIKKEIFQLWKTRRLLVTGAVFLLFGMGSPLIAKFTPEILRSVSGMEQFAGLIPEPTASDAIAQYVKNLTQFGFLLAVLIGMSAVVGEKERGVAPMILSKPMPRWAFIVSKFAAQTAMYLGCFALSGAGAYYYTWVLFGPLQPDPFILLNVLLLLWVLSFVALALLGSTLGKTTVSAGGIGFVLSVAMMLAGSIPRYGAMLPGGLLSWVDQAGKAAAETAAAPAALSLESAGQIGAGGGALASTAVLIVMAVILSLGVFEQQEL